MKERAKAKGSLRKKLEMVHNEALKELNSHKKVISSI
jgi:hypothetical protein